MSREPCGHGVCADTCPRCIEEAYIAVGKGMVAMTTTVRGVDEWAAIPELWLKCLQERDALRAQLAARPT